MPSHLIPLPGGLAGGETYEAISVEVKNLPPGSGNYASLLFSAGHLMRMLPMICTCMYVG